MKNFYNLWEDVLLAVEAAFIAAVIIAIVLVVSSCSTIRVNASQTDGTISVTSTPNQPVQVSVQTTVKDPDIM